MMRRIPTALTAITYAIVLIVSGLTSQIHAVTPSEIAIMGDHGDHGEADGNRCSDCNCCQDFGCNSNHSWACGGSGNGCGTHLFRNCSNQDIPPGRLP